MNSSAQKRHNNFTMIIRRAETFQDVLQLNISKPSNNNINDYLKKQVKKRHKKVINKPHRDLMQLEDMNQQLKDYKNEEE